MAGFRGGHGNAHGFGIAHLADDEHVWRLAKSGAQRGGKIGRVMADFNLLNHAADICVLILNGIFDRDDVARVAAIDLIHQRGNRRRFARARRPADQDKSARKVGKLFDRGRKMQLMQKRNGRGQRADGSGGASTLLMQIDAEAAKVGVAIRRVGDADFKILAQRMRHQRGRDGVFNLVARELSFADGNYLAVHSDAGRRVGDEQQVAAAPLDQLDEPAVEFGERRISHGECLSLACFN